MKLLNYKAIYDESYDYYLTYLKKEGEKQNLVYIWKLFYKVGLLEEELYNNIFKKRGRKTKFSIYLSCDFFWIDLRFAI